MVFLPYSSHSLASGAGAGAGPISGSPYPLPELIDSEELRRHHKAFLSHVLFLVAGW